MTEGMGSIHASSAELLALIDNELPEDRQAQIGTHIEECATCAAHLAALHDASRTLTEALQAFDRPAPQMDPSEVLDRKGSRGKSPLTRRALLNAAVLVLLLGGASAAAVPGSPVRDWLSGSVKSVRAWLAGEGPAQADASATASDPAAVAVAPRDGRVRVSLLSPAPDAMIRVSVVDAPEASVSAVGARFRTGPGWIEVVDAAGSILIDLPRSTVSARVEIDGSVVVRKEGEALRLLTSESQDLSSVLRFPASE